MRRSQDLRSGRRGRTERRSPTAAVEAAHAAIAADGRAGIWIELVDRDVALAAAAEVERRLEAGADLALAGATVAAKANMDVVGLRTTAGCPTYGEVATRSAAAIRALEAAGAVVVGVTNLDQFATGLVGTRSPHGACPNAHWPGLISGGSSSGSAVAVAAGHVDLALGTDTAGSGRIPAGANGIVGLKPTRGRISTAGVVPACRSLDCVSILSADVDLAALALDLVVAGGADPEDPWSRASPLRPVPDPDRVRLGIARIGIDDVDGEIAGLTRFASASATVVQVAGGFADEVDISAFIETGQLLYGGSFVAERFEAVGDFVTGHLEDVDPVVGSIISAAGFVPGWQVFRDQTELARLRAISETLWADVDVLVVPTMPRVPTIAEVAADPIGVNSMLGRFTNFVNLLDLCALTIPVGASEPSTGNTVGPPASVTLIAPAWCDDVLVSVARRVMRGSAANHRAG